MKTKKREVTFCVGLIIVLINAVSSELLITNEALNYIPNYTNMPVEGDVGKPLVYTPINYDSPFKVFYEVDTRDGDEIRKIRFEAETAAQQHQWMLSELWLGKPGIEVNQGEGDERTLLKYSFEGIEIDLQKVGHTAKTLMRIRLKFYNFSQERIMVVKMIMIKTPATEEDVQLVAERGVYNCRVFKSFQELKTRMDSEQISVTLPDDFPWIKKILKRAKFTGIRPIYPNIDWYYAGAFMVNRDMINGILRLDSRWERHIIQ